MAKEKKELELKLKTNDLVTLLAFLDVDVKDMQVSTLMRTVENTNFTLDFLLDVAKEEVRIEQKIIRTELQLMVEEACQEEAEGETLQ